MQEPLIKWAGGKRWLARKLLPEIRHIDFDTYIEPFFGGGALFFALAPVKSIIADDISDLMNFYSCVARQPIDLYKLLTKLTPSKRQYYRYRDRYHPFTPLMKAVRFYLLTSNSWNGLYRVNLKGKFNVPYSYKAQKITISLDEFLEYSKRLRKSRILCQDFEKTIKLAKRRDFIFADPPYFSKKNNTFAKYNPAVFNESDQSRLAKALIGAEGRGASWILTNGSLEQISNLFIGYDIFEIPRYSIIAGNKTSRRLISEYVVLSNNLHLDEAKILLDNQFTRL